MDIWHICNIIWKHLSCFYWWQNNKYHQYQSGLLSTPLIKEITLLEASKKKAVLPSWPWAPWLPWTSSCKSWWFMVVTGTCSLVCTVSFTVFLAFEISNTVFGGRTTVFTNSSLTCGMGAFSQKVRSGLWFHTAVCCAWWSMWVDSGRH